MPQAPEIILQLCSIEVPPGRLALQATVDDLCELVGNVLSTGLNRSRVSATKRVPICALISQELNRKGPRERLKGEDAKSIHIAGEDGTSPGNVLRAAVTESTWLVNSREGCPAQMSSEPRIHKDEPARSPSPHIACGEIPVHYVELMASAEPFAEVDDETPDIADWPRKASLELTKIRSVEQLFHPANHLWWITNLDGLRQDAHDIGRLDRGEKLHLSSCTLQDHRRGGSIRNGDHLDDARHVFERRFEDKLLATSTEWLKRRRS